MPESTSAYTHIHTAGGQAKHDSGIGGIQKRNSVSVDAEIRRSGCGDDTVVKGAGQCKHTHIEHGK